MYEYGYTITTADGSESRDTVLGTCDESQLAEKQHEVDYTNRMEKEVLRRPSIGGGVKGRTNTTYWVRPCLTK